MRAFLYSAIAFAFGVFMVGCAEYADNGVAIYEDEYGEEIIEEYAQDTTSESISEEAANEAVATNNTDDGIANMASNLATTAPSDDVQNTQDSSTESSEGELAMESNSDESSASSAESTEATTDSSQMGEVATNEESTNDKSNATESSTPSEVAIVAPEVTEPTQTPQVAQSTEQVPQITQSAEQATTQGITKIDENTFEYNGMTFKHNLGKDADLDAILSALNKEQSQTPKAEPQSIDKPKADSNLASGAKTKIRGKGLKGLSQSTTKLKAQCEDKGDLQKCEDLGRIYATRGNLDNATKYYELACDNGGGLALSCFFLSKIYENDGDNEAAGHYASLIDEATLKSAKVGRTELLLSTGKATTLKRNLKMSCAQGDTGSCDTLQSVFKLRGEKHEMKTFFGTECWKGSELGCNILRSM